MKQNQLIALAAIVLLAFAFYAGFITIKTPSGNTIGGQPTATTPVTGGAVPLTLNLPFLDFNGTSLGTATTNPQAMLFQGSPSISTFVGSSASGAAISGAVVTSQPYTLLVAPATAGTFGTADNLVSSGNGVTIGAPSVTTYQGQFWTAYPVTFSNVGQIATGITSTITLYGYTACTGTTTSLLNSTAIGASSYGYATTTSYFSGFTGHYYGQGFKLVRLQLNMSATNATDYDSGAFTLKSVTLNMGNGQSMTTSNIVWQGISNALVDIGSSNGALLICGSTSTPQYQYNALPVFLGQSDSPTGTMTINFNWYGESANSFVYSVKMIAMTPTGTTATTYSGGSVS
jgi:hypothetical protein